MDVQWEAVDRLELGSVRRKFEWKKGRWWRMWNDAGGVEKEYRQFLYLIATHPDKVVVPWSRDLDDFWHHHILDTAKYARDCDSVIGRMIHHDPHLPEGSRPHATAFADTRAMHRATFGHGGRARRGNGTTDAGWDTDTPFVFSDSGSAAAHAGHHGHHDAGHHGGSHGGDHGGGHDGGGHGCGGHGCGGHGGH